MRILVLSADAGNGMLSFIMRAMDDGHAVKWYFSKPIDWRAQPVGKGIADIVHDWRGWARWADLIVLDDNTKHLTEIDVWRRDRGARVIGATSESAAWELDRKTGMDIFKAAGIPTPPVKEFDRYDDAIRYVEREGRAFVSKPNGDTDDKGLSYVAKSAADMIFQLRKWKGSHKHRDSFVLQEKVSGVEFAVGAWLGPNGFTHGFTENMEHKKLHVGDLGPNTGEMGTVLMHASSSKLAQKVLKPLEERLVATGHTGYVDVNCIVSPDGTPWPLEFTMRFGWPTFPIQQALLAGDCAEWLLDLAEGRDARPWITDEVAVGVVVACGSFPHGRIPKEAIVGIPIYGAEGRVLEDLHFCEVMAGMAPHDVDGRVVDRPTYLTAGDYVMSATGTGETVTAARRRAYAVLDKISMPSSPFWRVDIGRRLAKCLPELQAHGMAQRWSYG